MIPNKAHYAEQQRLWEEKMAEARKRAGGKEL
jgi:hypothetical protein